MSKMTKRSMSLLLSFALCLTLLLSGMPQAQAANQSLDLTNSQWWYDYATDAKAPADDLTAPGVDKNGQVTAKGGYILFTSDLHCCTYLAEDLLAEANKLIAEDGGQGNVGLFALGGDVAETGLSPDVMTMLKEAIGTSNGTVAVYTRGNHEGSVSDEEFKATTGMSHVGETAISADSLYHLYSFGMTDNQTFLQKDIDALAEYLAGLKDDKPVFILSHFPIHYLNSLRSVYDAGGKELVELLNQYPQVIFTWGHNHSEADPSYGTVRLPGETLTYGPNPEDTVEINFTYMNNGAGKDGVNSCNGVLVKVNEDGSVRIRAICLDLQIDENQVWVADDDTEVQLRTAGTPSVISDITRPVLNEDYYKTINAAQVFIDRPKVDKEPAAKATAYSNRFEADGKVEWSLNGNPLPEGTTYDFETAYTATVTLKAKDGYTFAEQSALSKVSGINPVYNNSNPASYNVGDTKVERSADGKTATLTLTFEKTAESLANAASPAAEIVEGNKYVMATNDSVASSVYYKYAYQEGARRQSVSVAMNDVVIRDGKLASKPDTFEIFTAAKDDFGYQLWSDASLKDHGYGENSITTLSILNMSYRGGKYDMETGTGNISIYSNWNIDDEGHPYLTIESVRVYPCCNGASIGGTTDPAECNMRLYEVGKADSSSNYIVVRNVTAPVTGATPETGTSGDSVTWSPADETFAPNTVYTATVTKTLASPITDAAAAIGRINGKDADMTVSDDGKTVTLTRTFAATLSKQTLAEGAAAKKAESLEAGKTYVLVADGLAMTSQSTNGMYLDGAPVTVTDGAITGGITKEMLFTVEATDKDGIFYIKSSSGYLIGRKENPDDFGPYGILANNSAPAMQVSYADGKLLMKDTGVKAMFNFGGEPDPNYFYVSNGVFNHTEINSSDFSIYEVDMLYMDIVGHWAEADIRYVIEKGLFKDTGAGNFSPNLTMTRAMLMTVLARYDGQDTDGGATWYEKGMKWAVDNGVSDGTAPDDSITREQLVTMLWRYIKSPAASASLDSFPDGASVSDWATEAMTWAVETGLIKGSSNGKITPQGNATRAEVATILARFIRSRDA